ncbi:methylated-DNA--[protein]-cysteine S-methyltransferase [Candidatus Peribacteria bacterium]|nr:methylated-DNA--[protein]-cysteine S-methyltransferase [Candidatus Peribacteria bacterium]
MNTASPSVGIEHASMASPVGNLRIEADAGRIVSVTMVNARSSKSPVRSKILRECQRQLTEYFSGRRTSFTLPLAESGTLFQRTVRKALASVESGTTLTYGELAKRSGFPKAIRAVASVVANNPFGIVVPCHRIVPSSGVQPGKYAWGTSKKKWLLEHEGNRS